MRASLQGRTILLVEDESLIVFDVTRALEREGARVVGAGDAARAIERIGTFGPDAAILDLKLGRGDTCEPVAERLSELDIPFVLHSGDTLRHAPLLARLGVPVFEKPYPSHRLVERVVELLASRAVSGIAQKAKPR